MTGKIVFHIGLPKTATSYIQGLVFPEINSIGFYYEKNLPKEIARIVQDAHRDGSFEHAVVMREWLKEAARLREAHENILLTREFFSMCPYSDKIHAKPYSVRAEDALEYGLNNNQKRLLEIIKELFPDAEIILVIRNQLDFMKSWYKQIIKAGSRNTFSEFLNWKNGSFYNRHKETIYNVNALSIDYSLLVQETEKLFGEDKVHVLCYETLKHNPEQYFHQLESIMGAPFITEKCKTSRVVNPSYSTSAIKPIVMIRKALFWRTEEDLLYGDTVNLKIKRWFDRYTELYEAGHRTLSVRTMCRLRDVLYYKSIIDKVTSVRAFVEQVFDKHIGWDRELFTPEQVEILRSHYREANKTLFAMKRFSHLTDKEKSSYLD